MAELNIPDDEMPYLAEAVISQYDSLYYDARQATSEGQWPGEIFRALDALEDIRDQIEEAGFSYERS